MKTIKDITIEEVQDLFDSVIYLRGEEYFECDCVKSIEPLDSSTIVGVVRGNQDYNVTVAIDSEEDIVCECSCPCDFNCKHAAALLLKWLSIKDGYNKELKKANARKKESISDILGKKSREELIGLLDEFTQRHPDLKTLVKVEGKEITSKISGLFSGFWEWNEIDGLISQLETVLDGIKRNKSMWDTGLLKEMDKCSNIMVRRQENVHDEGDLGLFLEEWFLTYGEVFASTNPSDEEKERYIKKIMEWVRKDNYGLDGSYEKAFLGMCNSKVDIELIQKFYKPAEGDGDHYRQFYLELYDKIGLDDDYIAVARKSAFTPELVDKLVSLGRLEEALAECKKNKAKEHYESIEDKRIDILKKLGRNEEAKKIILDMVKTTGDFSYAARLKKESDKGEWHDTFRQIVSDSRKKNRNNLLSRMYYGENDFKRAYEHSGDSSDADYLELLAKKLGTSHPTLACKLFRRLCFDWINAGSGWPYRKAGKMLESIRRLDKQGKLFEKTKNEIIALHKRKYSLMEIIKNV